MTLRLKISDQAQDGGAQGHRDADNAGGGLSSTSRSACALALPAVNNLHLCDLLHFVLFVYDRHRGVFASVFNRTSEIALCFVQIIIGLVIATIGIGVELVLVLVKAVGRAAVGVGCDYVEHFNLRFVPASVNHQPYKTRLHYLLHLIKIYLCNIIAYFMGVAVTERRKI